jgi:hypothetical protein
MSQQIIIKISFRNNNYSLKFKNNDIGF